MPDTTQRCSEFEVRIERVVSHRYRCSRGLLDDYGEHLAERIGRARLVVLIDAAVRELYGARLAASLSRAQFRYEFLCVPAGETAKSLSCFVGLLDDFAALGVDRRTVIVNFGGGTISDLGGFAASAYMRGLAYANFATTLIGQLDASIGGKVGVNTARAKNHIGAFHHPLDVACDPELLHTLDWRDFKSGLAEGIKVAILASPELFETLETEREGVRARSPERMERIIAQAAQLKMELVERDPFERDLRRPLNLGHTLGHPLETAFEYQGIRHGEAVAVGIGVATCVSLRRGWIEPAAAERILDLLASYDLLWTAGELPIALLLEHLEHVRRVRAGRLNFVLPTAIGAIRIVEELPDAEIVAGFNAYSREVGRRSSWNAVAS